MKEPELVASGFAFLVPAYVAWTGGQIVSAAALTFLAAIAITLNLWTIQENEKSSSQTTSST